MVNTNNLVAFNVDLWYNRYKLLAFSTINSYIQAKERGIYMERIKDFISAGGIVIVGLLIIAFFIYAIVSNIQLWLARVAATKNPTEENAWRVYQLLCRFAVGINNHPEDWGKFRDMFYEINCSDKVPSELKEKLKMRLIKKGLYIKNMRIIDNYKGGK